MGLIYVNPEGPNGNPDPVASGRDIRETFARMAMNDEETVALIAGGHTFGKCHGAGDPPPRRPRARGRPLEEHGPRLEEPPRQRQGRDTSPAARGRVDAEPDQWDNGYFDMLFGYEWELVKSPAGAWQWLAEKRRSRCGPRARRARPVEAHVR
jgi:catalase-peroxidase